MMRLQNGKDDATNANGDKNLVKHSGAYLVSISLAQVMNGAYKKQEHYPTKRHHLMLGNGGIVEGGGKMGKGREMVEESIVLLAINHVATDKPIRGYQSQQGCNETSRTKRQDVENHQYP